MTFIRTPTLRRLNSVSFILRPESLTPRSPGQQVDMGNESPSTDLFFFLLSNSPAAWRVLCPGPLCLSQGCLHLALPVFSLLEDACALNHPAPQCQLSSVRSCPLSPGAFSTDKSLISFSLQGAVTPCHLIILANLSAR